eukprot:scaffold41484_cov97-Attheya_sp.AAC.1
MVAFAFCGSCVSVASASAVADADGSLFQEKSGALLTTESGQTRACACRRAVQPAPKAATRGARHRLSGKFHAPTIKTDPRGMGRM